jgi:hypothetical protein
MCGLLGYDAEWSYYQWFGEIFCLHLEDNYVNIEFEAGNSSEFL